MKTIWIDTTTGTWGELNNALVVLEVTDEQIERLDGMADSTICQIGMAFGTSISTTEPE